MTGFIITSLSIMWTWVSCAAMTIAAKIPQDTFSQLQISTLPIITEYALKISTGFIPLALALAGTLFLIVLHLKTTKENTKSLVQNFYLGFWITYSNLTFVAFLMPLWIPVVRIK